MNFDSPVGEYPSAVHRMIALHARRMTPPETSLSGMEDPNLKISCREYYNFVVDMLEDMLQYPQLYGMHPGEYEAFLGGRAENAVRQKQTSKMNTIRSRTTNCVENYFVYLFQLASLGLPDRDTLRISEEDAAALRLLADGSLTKKRKTVLTEIPYSLRLSALSRVGMEILDGPGGTVVISKNHPKMFPGMRALAAAATTVGFFGEHNFAYCDFRQITEKYTPNASDVLFPLSGPQRGNAADLHAILCSMGLRPTCETYWKVNYHWKGKHVACLDTDCWNGRDSFLLDHYRLRVDGSQDDAHLEAIAAKGPAFQHFYMAHLNYCTHCSTSHIGGIRQVFGRNIRLCCCPQVAFRIENPQAEDFEKIQLCVRLRCEAIQRENAKNE